MSAPTKNPAPVIDAAPEHTGGRGAALVQKLVLVRELGIVAALLLLIVATVIANPRFLSAQNLRDLLLSASITGAGLFVGALTRPPPGGPGRSRPA